MHCLIHYSNIVQHYDQIVLKLMKGNVLFHVNDMKLRSIFRDD